MAQALYGDLIYKFKKIEVKWSDILSNQFRKITIRCKRIGYNINVMGVVCMLSCRIIKVTKCSN